MKLFQKKRQGFTLIELVVVIVIIAILAAAALLRFGAFTETATDSRIKSEHSQLITAGNMWRAAQDDPTQVPSGLDDILSYMEESKEILDAHDLSGGVLTSTLKKAGATPLTYDFNATTGP